MVKYSQWCEDGFVLCCVCFGCFTKDQLHRDPTDGKYWDVCQRCWDEEEAHADARTR